MSEWVRDAVLDAVRECSSFTVAELVAHFRGRIREDAVRTQTWVLIGEHRLNVGGDWTLTLATPQPPARDGR